ncbi:MAG: hypothetical protein AAGA54_34920 [Myxococcota bacterium]
MTADAPKGAVSCGPLRREPDGHWYLGSHYLGQDDDPEVSLVELEARVGVVLIMVADALEQACGALEKWGDAVPVGRALTVLRRYHRWQATGRW